MNQSNLLEVAADKKRKSIWEIPETQHCSIVGTCLTIGEARAIGRKIQLRVPNPEDLDSTVHSVLVKESAYKNRVSILLNKALNKKYENSIRLFRACKSPDEILSFWRDSFDVGNIPGPYWAALSHPYLDHDVAVKIYSDLHMLSHLVGASNRADIARLTELEIDLADAQAKNKKLIASNNQKLSKFLIQLSKHVRRIAELERQNLNMKARLIGHQSDQSIEELNSEFSNGVLISGDDYGSTLRDGLYGKSKIIGRNLRLQDEIERVTYEKTKLRLELEEKQTELEIMSLELQTVEATLKSLQGTDGFVANECNLGGKCVLYIGGRNGSVCRMCDIVDKLNGRLIHHDGGKEHSLAALPGAVSTADAVIFPTDRISHSSALEAKKLCKKMSKPYVPVRTSSLTSLIKGLVEVKELL